MHDNNPLVRALALRTMSYIHVREYVEATVPHLKNLLRDSDPYVRKTAAFCVAKLYDHDRQLVESSDLLQRESSGIQAEVSDALMQLQFQDRVSQILSHVQQNIARLPSYLDEHAQRAGNALPPIDPRGLLAELESTYAMAEERTLHGRSALTQPQPQQHQQAEELTFF